MKENYIDLNERIEQIFRDYGEQSGLGPDQVVFRSFSTRDPKDKKAAAEYFRWAIQTWADDPQLQDDMVRHELGHALADKGNGQFCLQALITSQTGDVTKSILRPSYAAIGPRTPKQLLAIIRGDGKDLSDGDREQIKIPEEEIAKSKRRWKFWD